jgi:hypothetical protein
MMHNIACIFAQALARAQADLQEKDRKSLADGYRSRALEAVRQTLALVPPAERLPFWKEKVLPDAALTPIRNEAEFQRILDEAVPRR